MSQCAQIWAYLEDGNTLTPLEAYQMFGCAVLHSRISELRSRGHQIDKEMVKVGNKRVGRYSMPVRIAYG